MGYEITKETLDRIQMLAAEYAGLEVAGTASPEWKSKKAAMERLQKKNKEAGISLLDSCFCGPESMNKLLVDVGDKPSQFNDRTQLFFALAMDEIVGTSAKLEYNKESNSFMAKTATSNGELKYDPKDLELGIWDKICAAFGITTEHAKKVALAQESMKAVKESCDSFNKSVVIDKKNQFLKKHEEFEKQNEAVINEAKETETGFKKLFFGEKYTEGKDYTFQGGKTISALSACIAMYHKSGSKDLANMSLEEINKPENEGLRKELSEIGKEYMDFCEKSKNLSIEDKKLKYLDDFLFEKQSAFSHTDKLFLERMKTNKPLNINYDNIEVGKDITDERRQSQMKGAKALTMLTVKAELRKLYGKQQKTGYHEISKDDMQYLDAYKEAKENAGLMSDMRNGYYQNASKYFMKNFGEVGGSLKADLKSNDYNRFLEAADQFLTHKEIKLGMREPGMDNLQKDEMEMDDGFNL